MPQKMQDKNNPENEGKPPPGGRPGKPYHVSSDMDLDGRFQDAVLEMTDEEIRTSSGGSVRVRLALEEVELVRCTEFVGNGMLQARLRDGREVPLMRYSKRLSEQFEEAEKLINQRLGKELTQDEKEGMPGDGPRESKLVFRCPSCGHPLHHPSDVCPKCVKVRLVMLRLLKFLRPYWKETIVSMTIAVTMTALALLPPVLTRELIDGVLDVPEARESRRGEESRGKEAFDNDKAFQYARAQGVDESVLLGTGTRGLISMADVKAYVDARERFASESAQRAAWKALAHPDVIGGTGQDGKITRQDVAAHEKEVAALSATEAARRQAFLMRLDLRDVPRAGANAQITDADVVEASKPVRGNKLLVLVAAFIGVYVVGAILGGARSRLMGWMGARLMFDIRSRLYRVLQRLSLAFYDREHTGRIMSRVTNDTSVLNGFVVSGFQSIIMNVLTIVSVCAIMLVSEWHLALLTLLPTPLMILGTYLFARKASGVYNRIYRRRATLYKVISEAISGVRVVKAFGQEEREIDEFDDKSREFRDATIESVKLRSYFGPSMGLLTQLGQVVIFSYGGYLAIRGSLSMGELVMFTALMAKFYGPVQGLSSLADMIQSTAVASKRVFSILDTPSEVADAVNAAPLEEPRGSFVFEGVDFAYEKGERTLKNINLEVRPGETIGLVGATGSGKSTLVKLVSRFYDATHGRILLDGRDLTEIRLADLRKNIGIVLQETFLFSSPIRNNIAYGRPDATNEEIVAAARAANAHDFIMEMPDAYDTHVGERGLSLSGGERQRLAIARAILMDPAILILDEATSAVDTATEAVIQEAMDRLVHGRTVFAIAHRLSTLKNADRLVVMERGEIAEMGTHDELMAKPDGIYRNLVEIQNLFSIPVGARA